jgi:hypothetical protein
MDKENGFKIFVVLMICVIVLLITNLRSNVYSRFEIIANNQKILNHNQAIALTEFCMVLDMRIMDSLSSIKIDTLSKTNKVKFNTTLDGVISRCEKRKSMLDSIQLGINTCIGSK